MIPLRGAQLDLIQCPRHFTRQSAMDAALADEPERVTAPAIALKISLRGTQALLDKRVE
jgi:hypothetical protein